MEVSLKQLIGSLDKDQRALRDWAAEPVPNLSRTAEKKTRWGEDKSGNELPKMNALPNLPNGGSSGSGTFRIDEFGRRVFEPSPKVKKNKKKGKKRNWEDTDDGENAFLTTDEVRARQNRQRRFEKMNQGPTRYTFSSDAQHQEEIDWDNLDKYTIKGTCTEIEKKYYRLTSAPNPATVRPEPVLRKALQHIKLKWKENPNYEFTIDQLKSIRQDMTVQHIKNDLAIDVYETNARISLENGDINNFNQCQIAVKDLYKEGLAGSHAEFAAYRMLYTAFYINSTRGMSRLLHELGAHARGHPAVKHASAVRQAVADANYISFFRLLDDAPNMGSYLMEFYIPSMRTRALRNICRAYKPTVPVGFLQSKLGFDDEEELLEFLEKAGGVCKEGVEPSVIDCKASEGEFKRLDAEAEALKAQKQF